MSSYKRFRDSRRGGQKSWHHKDVKLNKSSLQNNESVSTKQLGEVELGITEYVREDVEGFDGVIKARYSDFQVSEVDVEGKIAKLTDLSVPRPNKSCESLDTSKDDVLSQSVWNDLQKLLVSEDSCTVEVDVSDATKEQRTKIYETVARVYKCKICGSTQTKGDKKFIIFSKLNRAAGRKDSRVRWEYPEEFVHFIVYKENMDTMEAAQAIAEGLHLSHIKPSFFGYSGTKDRRAKTTQWFSLKKVDPHRIANCAKRLRNVFVGNFEFRNYHLSLGYLKGNHFRIALRNVTQHRVVVDRAVESLKQNGFINYYGLQRFGSRCDVPTYEIGKHLLRREFQEAIDLILTPQGPFSSQLMCYRESRDASKALSLFPKHANSLERTLLMALAKHAKNDLVTALEHLPRNMRLLYMHSYQSWVWNRCVSQRMKRHGMHLVPGDLVIDTQHSDAQENFEMSDIQLENEECDDEAPGTDADAGSGSALKYPKVSPTPMKVKEVTQEDITNGKYSIYHLVLPLPGYNVIYPPNLRDFYQEVAAQDHLDLNVKHNIKAYNLSGTYRKVLIKPQDLTWKHVGYQDPTCDLIRSDWEQLRNVNNVECCDEGRYRGLIVEFTLCSSTYATMALRELMKRDTSARSQALQNDYHKTQEEKTQTSDTVQEAPTTDAGEKRKQAATLGTADKKMKIDQPS